MIHTFAHAPYAFSCRRGLAFPATLLFWGMLCAVALFGFALSAYALPPQAFVVESPRAEATDGTVRVSLAVSVDNEDGLRDMLKDGAVLALSIGIALERDRAWWMNETVFNKDFVSTIGHDPLTRDFVLTLPSPDGDRASRDKNLTRLLHATWRKISVPVIKITSIPERAADDVYSIVLTISLQHTEVPPWLRQNTVFWSSDVVPSKTITLPLQLPAPGEPKHEQPPQGK
jgi:hypothetical protein